jgi:hypothetical protein
VNIHEEGSLIWRIEHSVSPPALAPLLDELKNVLLAIHAETDLDKIRALVERGLKGG